MEIYPLRALVTGAELGHLTKASEKLHLSQPALSGQIRALEEELGLTLFTRSPARDDFTRAGQRLLKQAHKLLADVQQLGDLGQGACRDDVVVCLCRRAGDRPGH